MQRLKASTEDTQRSNGRPNQRRCRSPTLSLQEARDGRAHASAAHARVCVPDSATLPPKTEPSAGPRLARTARQAE
eukprot:1441021-Pleurochrysis_carterae.AAC.1